MISQIKSMIPVSLEPLLVRMWFVFRPFVRILFHGSERHCPVCDSWCRVFLPHGRGSRKRKDVVCPVCLSHARQRIAWLFIERKTGAMEGRVQSILHIAPEIEIGKKLREIPDVRYVSIDLESPHAMRRMDVTDLQIPDRSFQVVYCSHVLEHVPEDRKAIREIFRVLKPGGWCLFQVPVSGDHTTEDPGVEDPDLRDRLFHWPDHVRSYGLDVEERFASAGFHVDAFYARQFIDEAECGVMAVSADEPVFYCTKPEA